MCCAVIIKVNRIEVKTLSVKTSKTRTDFTPAQRTSDFELKNKNEIRSIAQYRLQYNHKLFNEAGFYIMTNDYSAVLYL